MNLLQKLFPCLCLLNLAVSQSWWQTGVIYQIYPRSFQDSDGDGIGDLKGITQRLDYLKDIGVSAIWLSPIYKSPMADFGYDIANFREIDPIFGTMDDFTELKKNCTERDIKLVLDFVPNHSSDENEWFTKSVAREENYTDYYIWRDALVNNVTNETAPPNNWISVFGGPAWTWNEDREQYYLHQFLDKQPDLNYRDENLVQEMKDVLTFWMKAGVDGFRVDAIPYLFEVETFEDEPLSGDTNAMPNETNYLNHIYTQNRLETYDMVQQWRELMDELSAADNQSRVMMLEAYASIEQVMQYYGTEDRPGAHFPFNFLLITDLNGNSNAKDFDAAIHKWLDNMPNGSQPNWVIGNHDNHRVASRYAPGLVDGLNMLDLLLPGTAITYYGEEIGMEDTYIPPDEVVDVSGRDPERTPMQWKNTTSAGFSDNATTWLRVNDNYPELNVENQLSAERSHLSIYKSLVQLRKSDIIQRGAISTRALSASVFYFERYLDNNETSYMVLINLGEEETEAQDPQSRVANYTVYVANVNSTRTSGDNVTFPLHLHPKEALVLEVMTIDSVDPTGDPTGDSTSVIPETTTLGAGAISAGILLTLTTSLVALLFNH